MHCYTLSPSKAQLRTRLPQQRQDCLYFYGQISAFIDQFHSRFQILLWKSFLYALHVDIFLHKTRLKQILYEILSKPQKNPRKSTGGINPTQWGHRVTEDKSQTLPFSLQPWIMTKAFPVIHWTPEWNPLWVTGSGPRRRGQPSPSILTSS